MLKLREYRKKSGMTMKRLGELVGASEASISQYETGRVEPDIELMTKIADVLGISVDSLIGRADEQETELPQTSEARILARGVDKLPQGERVQALNVVRAMFNQYSDYFDSRENADET